MKVDIQKLREDAFNNVKLFEMRYKNADKNSAPLIFVERWANAFSDDEINMNEIANIVREVEKEKDKYDMTFFLFCNDARKIYQLLMEKFLNEKNE